ncbi:hypothetical protein ABPG77_010073 [Micractinium sp. CCAP 211/92]
MAESAAELSSAMLTAGAVPALVALLRSSSDTGPVFAANGLGVLCSQDADAREAVAAAGGIAAAVQLSLGCLAAGSPQSSQAIIRANFGATRLLLQNQAQPEEREQAARVLAERAPSAELRAAGEVRPEAATVSTASVRSWARVCAADECVVTSGLKLCAAVAQCDTAGG